MNNAERNFIFTNGTHLQVGTIYCIGRNYSAHALEMGAEVPEKPLVFIKPSAAYMYGQNAIIQRPEYSKEMHHEAELVVVIGEDVPHDAGDEIGNYICGYGIGLDLTLRDVQSIAKQKGEPWSISKSFKGSAPISTIVPVSDFSTMYPQLTFSLSVNGIVKQVGNTDLMERSIPSLLKYISSVFSLRKGDCIFTGTPQGVGPLLSGDNIQARLDSYITMNCSVL
jgi:2-keto-4-pentenoate hydratase/2-oxohepta-3-ene-1,7-dioic acid hydratase in catechol pathway